MMLSNWHQLIMLSAGGIGQDNSQSPFKPQLLHNFVIMTYSLAEVNLVQLTI